MTKKAKHTKRMLSVRSNIEGFRRCGRAWSVAETLVDPSGLTKRELDALRAEPRLLVAELDVEVAGDDDASAAGEAA